MSVFDLIIFDCDGVLIESEWLADEVVSMLFREKGVDLSPEEVGFRYTGTSWDFMYTDMKENWGDKLDPEQFGKDFDAAFWPTAEKELTAVSGVQDFIHALAHDKCVCSNSSMDWITRGFEIAKLQGIDPAHRFAARDHGAGKPAPDVFLHAARIFDVFPERCLIIEDSTSGVKGGRAAGMTVAGFTGGSHCTDGHETRLTQAGAKFATPDWDVILDFIHA